MSPVNQKGIAHLLLLILLLAGIVLTVYLVGQKTQLFPWAASNPICPISGPCPSMSPSPSVSPSPSPVVNVDSDLDGFFDSQETFMGTDAGKACGVDAWPVDVNNDTFINGGDMSLMGAYIQGTNPYNRRYDLNQDSVINTADTAIIQQYFLRSCGPSAHWKFDEAGGASVAADSSGNGFNANLLGAAISTGLFGNGVIFNAQTNQIKTAAATLPLNNGNFSVSGWIHPLGNIPNEYSWLIGQWETTSAGWNVIYTSDLKLGVNLTDCSTSYAAGNGTKSMSANNWHYVVVTRDAVTGHTKLYVDGKLDTAFTNQRSGPLCNKSLPVTIGKSSFIQGHTYKGILDNFIVWPRVLPLSEIEKVYQDTLKTGRI